MIPSKVQPMMKWILIATLAALALVQVTNGEANSDSQKNQTTMGVETTAAYSETESTTGGQSTSVGKTTKTSATTGPTGATTPASPASLSCFECSTAGESVDDSACLDEQTDKKNDVKECNGYCQMITFSLKGNITSFSRSCEEEGKCKEERAKTCEENYMPGNIENDKKCTICCTTNHCNSDKASGGAMVKVSLVLSIACINLIAIIRAWLY